MLFRALAMAMVMQTQSAGDEFAECASGSSCPAFLEMIGSSETKIAIQEKVSGTNSQYYRIEVTPGNGADALEKYRPYSKFLELHEKFGDSEEFPPKLYFNSIIATFWPAQFEERRAKLETWMQAILKKEESKSVWADDLFTFLDPVSTYKAAKSGITMPPDANKICGNNLHYFGISVIPQEGVEPTTVFHRYSDFDKFNTSLAELGARENDFSVTLPPKLYWNAVIKLFESTLEERRKGLEAWLQQVKLHPKSAPGEPWAEKVKEFLDPEANKKEISFECMSEENSKVTMDTLQKYYESMKDKLNEFSDSFSGKTEPEVAPQNSKGDDL